MADVVRRPVHAPDNQRGSPIRRKRGVLEHDRVEDDVGAGVRLAEDPEMSRKAFGQGETGLLVEEDGKTDGGGREGVRRSFHTLLTEAAAQHPGHQREPAGPTHHVDTGHLGPRDVSAAVSRILKDAIEKLDCRVDERCTGRIDVVDTAGERWQVDVELGEVHQEAARLRPDGLLTGSALLFQEVTRGGIDPRQLRTGQDGFTIASSKSSPPRRSDDLTGGVCRPVPEPKDRDCTTAATSNWPISKAKNPTITAKSFGHEAC